jgi:enamine deaminase RidA (YjgF/YER057c/UK114 family)
MNTTPINPWDWSLQFGYSQGQVISGATRQLVTAGQTAVDASGTPQHAGDMRAQMQLAFDNLITVLKTADMDLSNIAKLSIHSTDIDATLENFDIFGAQLGAAGVTPPMTLLGTTRLAMPSLMIEIEATAFA